MVVEQGASVMALADITKSAVELAVAEYDEIGREEFLQRYGFSDAKQYWLIHNDQAYALPKPSSISSSSSPYDRAVTSSWSQTSTSVNFSLLMSNGSVVVRG